MLHLEKMVHVNKLQIMGGLTLVIDWANKKVVMMNLRVEHMLQEINNSLWEFQWTLLGLGFACKPRILDEPKDKLRKNI